MVPAYGYGNPDDLFAPVASGACAECGSETYDGMGHRCPGEVAAVLTEELGRLSEYAAREEAARLRADLRFQELIGAIERTYREYGERYAATGDQGELFMFVGALAAVMDIYAHIQLPTWSGLRQAVLEAQAKAPAVATSGGPVNP